MTEEQEPESPQTPPMIKKGCHISLMFPVKDDAEAMHVKQRIDAAVGDIKDKRYTFQITEM